MDGGTRSRPPFWLPDHRVGGGGEGTAQTPSPPPAPHSSIGVEPPNAALGERHGALGVRRWGSRGSRRAASHEGSQSSRSPIPLAQDPSQHQVGRFPVRSSLLPPRAPRGEHPRAEDLFHLQEPVPRAGTLCGSRRAAPHTRALGAPSCLRCTPCPTPGTQDSPGGDSRSSAAAHRSETRRPAARLRRVNSGGSAKSCSSIVNCSSNASSRSLSANRSSRGEHRAGSRSAVAARIFSPHPVLQRSIRDVPSFQVKPHQAAPISVALGRSRAVGLRWERRDPPWFLSSVLRLCAALPGRSSGRRCAEGGSAAPPRCNWGRVCGAAGAALFGVPRWHPQSCGCFVPIPPCPLWVVGWPRGHKGEEETFRAALECQSAPCLRGGGLEGAAAF